MARPIGIRIHKGNELIETQVFERDIIKIGRLASAHLRLEDPKVSRIHAVIDIANGNDVSIIDMGSAEGTRVNGEKVSRVHLKHGDEVGLGDSRLVIVLDEADVAGLKGGDPTSSSLAAPAAPVATAPASATAATGGPSPFEGGLPAHTGVFNSGPTDLSALRAELASSMPTTEASQKPADAPASFDAPHTTPVASPAPARPAPAVAAAAVPPPRPPARAPEPPPPPAPVYVDTMPPLPPIPEDRITPENRFIEVTVRWGTDVVECRRIRSVETFTIGRGDDDDVFVPLEGVAPGPSFVLLRSDKGGGWYARYTAQMSGSITRGEENRPLSQSGGSPEGDGFAVPLTDDTVLNIVVGQFDIEIRPVAKSRIIPIAPIFDVLWANTVLVTMFATAAMLSVVTLMPVGLDSMEDDLLTNPSKFQTLILKPPPKDNSFLNKLKGPKEQKQAAKNDQGKAGDKKAKPTETGRMATKAKEKPTDEQVVASKLNALFGEKGSGGIAQLFGEQTGGELEAALGGIEGGKVAAGYGSGGLGLRGGGPGGGGTGLNTLGTGKIGTRGRGSGEAGYGSGEGGLGGKVDRDVTMTTGTPVIMGSLDKEIIRRIVQEHASQIRYCYEKELTRTPGIFGKIVMKWVINGEGKVTQAQTAETQMKNANVEGCLATKIKTWVFPKPKGGGIVIVNYPFVFKQSG